MSNIIPNFSSANVLVVGDLMLDRYWTGQTQRISPEAPVPVVKIDNTEGRLGGAANVANNITSLGAKAKLCGVIGKDEAGQELLDLLRHSKIDSGVVEDPNYPTVTKLRIISQHQQLIRLDFEKELTISSRLQVLSESERLMKHAGVVVISDYAKGVGETCSSLIELSRQYNIPVIVDPKGLRYEKYRGASLITPNRSEIQRIVGICDSLPELFSRARALCERLNIKAMLITLSENGMALIQRDEEPLHIPTKAREVFDVTGAGDTVIATVATCLAAGENIENAVRLSNYAAGVVVGKIGTACVSQDELLQAIDSPDIKFDSAVMSLETLCTKVADAKRKGEKIVFTNGCFDLLHAGHVRYLKQAAKLGDRLVVALNSDSSVRKLKGESRPIVPLKERIEVVAELSCVDWVISFDSDTPLDIIEAITPNYLVKGGDYEPDNIVGAEHVNKNGGETLVMPTVEGCSTTNIIGNIASRFIEANKKK